MDVNSCRLFLTAIKARKPDKAVESHIPAEGMDERRKDNFSTPKKRPHIKL